MVRKSEFSARKVDPSRDNTCRVTLRVLNCATTRLSWYASGNCRARMRHMPLQAEAGNIVKAGSRRPVLTGRFSPLSSQYG